MTVPVRPHNSTFWLQTVRRRKHDFLLSGTPRKDWKSVWTYQYLRCKQQAWRDETWCLWHTIMGRDIPPPEWWGLVRKHIMSANDPALRRLGLAGRI